MAPSNLLSRQIAIRAMAEGGGVPLLVTAGSGPDHTPVPLSAWNDATDEPEALGYHYVNEEPSGRIVDYGHGAVFDDRRQFVAAMFQNETVTIEREELDW